MDILEKARILSSAGTYDSCGPKACAVEIKSGLGGIYHAKAEHATCRLFKTLMDNRCSFDCAYCANASGCKKKPVSYEPEELASLFSYLHTNLNVNGLFLSSGIAGDPDAATERMLDAVKIIRNTHHFGGYIHFKILPGTSYDLIKQASELATRMSINIEAPNSQTLSELSSCKDLRTDILRRQAWILRLNLRAGQTTQLILTSRSTDKAILRMMEWEYRSFHLRRMYFSAFRPVPGTPLEHDPPESLFRQNRLYNVDFLMRDYGYKPKEFDTIMDDGMLPIADPKVALARAALDSPVDINEAPYEELIRVPGIGPSTARAIITERTSRRITSFERLHRLGAWLNRAQPFITVDGKRQALLAEF